MIYCPHCQRPTARTSGECPHCGKSLDAGASDRSSDSKKEPQKQAAGESSAVQLEDDAPPPDRSSSSSSSSAKGDGSGSAARESSSEYEPPPEGMRGSGLELAIPVGKEGSSAALPHAALVEERAVIEKLANFSKPESGPIGAVRYFFAVRKRIKELDDEHRAETKAAGEAAERRRQNLVALGRRVHADKLGTPDLEPQLNRALVAEGELQGCLRQKEGLQRSYETRRKAVERELEQAREALKPIRDRLAAADKELAEAEKKHKGIAVQKKRIDIELRNRDELLEKRKKELEAVPEGEDRQKILADIKTLEDDRTAMRLKQDGLDVSLDEAEHECQKLRDDRGVVEEELNREKATEEAVAKKIDSLQQSFLERNKNVAGQVAAERAKAEGAWVAVAEEVLAARMSSTAIDVIVEDVGKEKTLEDDHTARAERLERARGTYDREIYAKGKRILVLAGAAAALLIVGIVALSALL